jgi:LPS sulfotransferase NodH
VTSARDPNSLVWALCCDARSGSTWFSQLIASTGRLGQPAEYLLNPPAWCQKLDLPLDLPLDRYLDLLRERKSSENGVFAIKGNLEPMRPFFRKYGNVPCVWLRRNDILEQAVSWYRAEKAGQWTRQDGQKATRRAYFDRDAILSYVHRIMTRRLAWESWFAEHQIAPLKITYEEICFDPLAAVRAVGRHVGVELNGVQHVTSPLRIVRDEVTERWVELLRQDC